MTMRKCCSKEDKDNPPLRFKQEVVSRSTIGCLCWRICWNIIPLIIPGVTPLMTQLLMPPPPLSPTLLSVLLPPAVFSHIPLHPSLFCSSFSPLPSSPVVFPPVYFFFSYSDLILSFIRPPSLPAFCHISLRLSPADSSLVVFKMASVQLNAQGITMYL